MSDVQEFQKWLEFCDLPQQENMMDSASGYVYDETESGHLYTFWSSGHSDTVTVEFDHNGVFMGFAGWD